MSLPITTLYALPLIAIVFPLWISVSSIRSKVNCSIGDSLSPLWASQPAFDQLN